MSPGALRFRGRPQNNSSSWMDCCPGGGAGIETECERLAYIGVRGGGRERKE